MCLFVHIFLPFLFIFCVFAVTFVMSLYSFLHLFSHFFVSLWLFFFCCHFAFFRHCLTFPHSLRICLSKKKKKSISGSLRPGFCPAGPVKFLSTKETNTDGFIHTMPAQIASQTRQQLRIKHCPKNRPQFTSLAQHLWDWTCRVASAARVCLVSAQRTQHQTLAWWLFNDCLIGLHQDWHALVPFCLVVGELNHFPPRKALTKHAAATGGSLCGELSFRPVMLCTALMTQGYVFVGVGTGFLPSLCWWVRWGLTRCPLSFLWVSVTSSPVQGPSAGDLAVTRAAECALYCRWKCSVGGSGISHPSDPQTPQWVKRGLGHELTGLLSWCVCGWLDDVFFCAM